MPSSLEYDPVDAVVLCCGPLELGVFSDDFEAANFSLKTSLRSDARMTSFSDRVSSGAPVTPMELMASNRRARQSCDGFAK